MTLLDVSGSGLFSNPAEFFHILGTIVKLAFGSFMILSAAVLGFIGITVYSLSKAHQTNSIMGGARMFVRFASYVIGIGVALFFTLVTTMFFRLAAFKLLFVAAAIAFVVAFVVRETFLFMVLKRFGKYLMYFTALRYVKETVYPNGQQENQP